MPKRFVWLIVLLFLIASSAVAGDSVEVNRGATETSPSRSEYFSWINNTNEGATEAQTLPLVSQTIRGNPPTRDGSHWIP